MDKIQVQLCNKQHQTLLVRIDMYINHALQTNDRLGLLAASCSGEAYLYCMEKTMHLDSQRNYVCLGKMVSDFTGKIPTYLVKQRTPQWFEIRQGAKATGSTLHKALGLSTHKEQQKHFETVTENVTAKSYGVQEIQMYVMKQ